MRNPPGALRTVRDPRRHGREYEVRAYFLNAERHGRRVTSAAATPLPGPPCPATHEYGIYGTRGPQSATHGHPRRRRSPTPLPGTQGPRSPRRPRGLGKAQDHKFFFAFTRFCFALSTTICEYLLISSYVVSLCFCGIACVSVELRCAEFLCGIAEFLCKSSFWVRILCGEFRILYGGRGCEGPATAVPGGQGAGSCGPRSATGSGAARSRPGPGGLAGRPGARGGRPRARGPGGSPRAAGALGPARARLADSTGLAC